MVIIILFSFVFVCLCIDIIVQYSRKKKLSEKDISAPVYKTISEYNPLIPQGLYFGKGHMWAFMEKNGSVRIGLDDFICNVTGSFNKVKMKSVGEKIQNGKPAVSVIQNGKLLSINAPLSGVVSTVNENLTDQSDLITSSPYTKGWIYTLVQTNWFEDSKKLMPTNTYRAWLKDEFVRLKDFIASINFRINSNTVPVIYQDGGELRKYFLEEFGPKVWDDFQTIFINNTSN